MFSELYWFLLFFMCSLLWYVLSLSIYCIRNYFFLVSMGFACLKNFKQYVSFVSICLRCLNVWLSLKGRDNINSFPEALPSAVRGSIIIRAALFPWLRLSQRLIVSLFRLIGSKIAVIVSTFYIGVDGIFSQSPRIQQFARTHL